MTTFELKEYPFVDDFTVSVTLQEISPLLEGFEHSSSGLILQYGSDHAKMELFRNPSRSAVEEIHSKRMQTLRYLVENNKFPRSFHDLVKLLKDRKAEPVIKITEPESARPGGKPKSFMLKVAHNPTCNRSWREEGELSSYLGDLEICPEIYGMFNPHSHVCMIIEEFFDRRTWDPVTMFYQKVDEVTMPRPFGRNLGLLHKVHEFLDEKGNETSGRFLYNDSSSPHSFWNPRTQRFKRVDLGETEFISAYSLRERRQQKRLMEEAINHAAELLMISRGSIYGVSQRHPTTSALEDAVQRFRDGYVEKSGVDVNFGYAEVRHAIARKFGGVRFNGKKMDYPDQELRKYAIL